MSQDAAQPVIAPLRMPQRNGTPYERLPDVEELLHELCRLPVEELLARARIQDSGDDAFIPSECLLYFLRRCPTADQERYRELFLALRQRVLAAVTVYPRRLSATNQSADDLRELEVRESVLHNFHLLLCKDRSGYLERLDYFECRFNAAVARLRATARRDARRDFTGQEFLDSDVAQGVPTLEVEQALARVRTQVPPDGDDFLYRSKLLRAISSLPADERRVIELILQEFTLEAIATVLDCVEKTVRNRRDRAYLKLQSALREEEDE